MAKVKVSKPKPIKSRNGGTMTEAAFWGKLRSMFRRGFQWWVPIRLALEKASRPSQSANKRLKKEYLCAMCTQWFPRKHIEVDHIVPCGRLLSYEDIGPFVERLACEDVDSYQVVCKPCHHWKTAQEKQKVVNKSYELFPH
jgi:5-methylcytosine-specific restriction endonuclease McrA